MNWHHWWLLLLVASPIGCSTAEHAASEVYPAADDGETVVLVHGMGRTRASMFVLGMRLRSAGYQTVNFAYSQSSDALHEISGRLVEFVRENVKTSRYHLIGHSLGNIVIRDAFRSGYPSGLGRVVMLAPPNRGAEIAKILKDNAVFQLVTGSSGQQLADFAAFEAKLAIPKAPFGIIAGGGATRNPLLSGDDDLLVGIEETKLPGASDFMVVDSLHRSLPKHPKTIEVTHRFLTRGYFQTERQRYRLPYCPDDGGVVGRGVERRGWLHRVRDPLRGLRGDDLDFPGCLAQRKGGRGQLG